MAGKTPKPKTRQKPKQAATYTIYDIARRCIGAVLAAIAVVAAFTVWRTGLLTTRFALLALLGLVCVAVLVVAMVRPKSRSIPGNLLYILAAVIIGSAGVYVNSVASSTSQFLGGIQRQPVTYDEYSIIAKKERRLQLAGAQSAAVLGPDSVKELSSAIAEKTSARQQNVADLTSMITSLQSNQADIAVLRSSLLPVMHEYDADFYKQIEVLTTFRIKSGNTASTTGTNVDVTKPYAIYISGIDTYGEVAAVSRSDVNMLAVVSPQPRNVLLVNTPRDYYVQLHGTTGLRDKLTHAGVYGIDTSRRTIQDLYGVPVPYYVRVNFTSLVKLVDVIGGVDVYSSYSFRSFEQGYNTLNGRTALEFARERYSFQDGDRQRGKNQQQVIEAIIAKLSRPENAVKLPQIMDVLAGSIQTNMPESMLKGMVRRQLDDTRSWSVNSIAVDGTGAMLPTHTYGNTPLYVMVPGTKTLNDAKRRIADVLQPE